MRLGVARKHLNGIEQISHETFKAIGNNRMTPEAIADVERVKAEVREAMLRLKKPKEAPAWNIPDMTSDRRHNRSPMNGFDLGASQSFER